MLIKKSHQLKVGDIVKINDMELKVLEVYSHWVLFQTVEEPYLKYSYQNVALLFDYHIYKKSGIGKGVVCVGDREQ